MANWDVTTKNSDFDAATAATTAMDARSAQRSGSGVNSSFGYQASTGLGGFLGIGHAEVAGTTAQSMGGYSIVGIDATKVPEMRTRVREAVTNIQTYLDGIKPAEATTDNAFKSEEIVSSVNAYIDSVKDYSKALISDLLAFSDKLQDVYDAWQSSSQTFASDSINTSTSSMSDATTYYTETK